MHPMNEGRLSTSSSDAANDSNCGGSRSRLASFAVVATDQLPSSRFFYENIGLCWEKSSNLATGVEQIQGTVRSFMQFQG